MFALSVVRLTADALSSTVMVEAKERMAQRLEHAPGDAARAACRYDQLNIFGRPIGIQVTLLRNHPFPEAPIGLAQLGVGRQERGWVLECVGGAAVA
jgi:hypothetical protein